MADTNARAALMRLRDRLVVQASEVGEDTAWWRGRFSAFRDAVDSINRELAALPAEMSPPFEGDPKDCAFKPADESAGASAGLVEAAYALVRWLDRYFPWEGRRPVDRELIDLCREVDNAIAAERARKPQPDEPVTDEMIETAIVAASDANFAVGEWDGDSAEEPLDAVTQVADAANQELRKLFERLRGQVAEKCEQLAELQSTAAAVFLDRDELRERLRQVERANETKANSVDQWRLRAEKAEGDVAAKDREIADLVAEVRSYAKEVGELSDKLEAISYDEALSLCREELRRTVERAEKAEARVAELEAQRLPPGSLLRVDHDLMALAKHPGSNLYHVKDDDRPMFVLADSWAEAVAAYEAKVRSENDMEPDEEVEILGVDFVANRRDILVAPIDVEAKR